MPARLAAAVLMGLLVALLAVLGAGPAAPAHAEGAYPPLGVRVVAGSVAPAVVPDGGTVTFSGSGFAPGALLRLSIDGTALRTLTADAAGAFRTAIVVRGVGPHVLAASGLEPGGRVRVVSGSVTATASRAAAPADLPRSGTDPVPALLGGLALVVAGAGLVHLARRRLVLA